MSNCSKMKYSVMFVIVLHLRIFVISIIRERGSDLCIYFLFIMKTRHFLAFIGNFFESFRNESFLLSSENKDTWYIESRIPFQKMCYGFNHGLLNRCLEGPEIRLGGGNLGPKLHPGGGFLEHDFL